MPDGSALLDVRPDGSQWRWTSVPAARARTALACGIAALTGGWKLYISLPDDPLSGVLEIVGLSKTIDRPEASGADSSSGLLLHVSIKPTPKAAATLTYTVTVTDSSATPVEQAAITLHNYQNNTDDIHHASTDRSGVATFVNLTLHKKNHHPAYRRREHYHRHLTQAERLQGRLRYGQSQLVVSIARGTAWKKTPDRIQQM